MLKLDGLIERAPHDMLIVSKSKQIVNVISERHPEIGIWTGDIQEGLYKKFVVATSQVLGVGVDGLQHKYQTIVVLDPVEEGSGEYAFDCEIVAVEAEYKLTYPNGSEVEPIKRDRSSIEDMIKDIIGGVL
ncbi:putative helicase [Streptococcus pneumoniae]|nr:putative helicase [Streptococcus pneumoniae]